MSVRELVKSRLEELMSSKNKSQAFRDLVAENQSLFEGYNSPTESVKRMYYNVVSDQSAVGVDLDASNLDPDNWKYAWIKNKGTSVFVKNPAEAEETLKLFDNFIERVSSHAPKYPSQPKNKEGRLLVVDPADVHIGKLSVKAETGHDYSPEIASERMREGVNGLLNEIDSEEIREVLFVIGNDILHTDNPKRTTTSGTPQDTVGQWWENFETAVRCYVEAIDLLMNYGSVKVVHCPSNHDYASGLYLAQLLKAWYRNADNITFDCSIQQRKYVVFGANLIGLSHGDGAKHSELQHLMTKEARGYISETRFRYFYIHHWHHKDRAKYEGRKKLSEKDQTSVTIIDTTYTPPEDTVNVEVIRSPSPPDAWHHRNGYVNEQAIEAFVHDPVKGQVKRVTHYF